MCAFKIKNKMKTVNNNNIVQEGTVKDDMIGWGRGRNTVTFC